MPLQETESSVRLMHGNCTCPSCGNSDLAWCTFPSLARTPLLGFFRAASAERIFVGYFAESVRLPSVVLRALLILSVTSIALSSCSLTSGLLVAGLSLPYLALNMCLIKLALVSYTCCTSASGHARVVELAHASYVLIMGLVLILDDLLFPVSSCFEVTDFRYGFYRGDAGCSMNVDFDLGVTFALILAFNIRTFLVVGIVVVHAALGVYVVGRAYGFDDSAATVRVAVFVVQQAIAISLTFCRERTQRQNFGDRHDVLQAARVELSARDEIRGVAAAQHLMQCPLMREHRELRREILCHIEVSELQDFVVSYRHSPPHLSDAQCFFRFLVRYVESAAKRHGCAVVCTAGDALIVMDGHRQKSPSNKGRDVAERVAATVLDVVSHAATKALKASKKTVDTDLPHHAYICDVALRAGVSFSETRVAALACGASQSAAFLGPGPILAAAFARRAMPGQVVVSQNVASTFSLNFNQPSSCVETISLPDASLVSAAVFNVKPTFASPAAVAVARLDASQLGSSVATDNGSSTALQLDSPASVDLLLHNNSSEEPEEKTDDAGRCCERLACCQCPEPVSNKVLAWSWTHMGFFLSARTEPGCAHYEQVCNFHLQVAANGAGFTLCALIMFASLSVAADFLRQIPCSIAACAFMLLALVMSFVMEGWSHRAQYAQILAVEFVVAPVVILALGPFSQWNEALHQLLPTLVTLLLLPILWASNFACVGLAVFLSGMRVLAVIATGLNTSTVNRVVTEVAWLGLTAALLSLRTLSMKTKYLRWLEAKIVLANAKEGREMATTDFAKILPQGLIKRFKPRDGNPQDGDEAKREENTAVDDVELISPRTLQPLATSASVLTFRVASTGLLMDQEAQFEIVMRSLQSCVPESAYVTYCAGTWQLIVGLSDQSVATNSSSDANYTLVTSFDFLQRLCYSMCVKLTQWNLQVSASLIRGLVSTHVVGLRPRVHILGAPLSVGRRLCREAENGTLALCDFSAELRRVYRDDNFTIQVQRFLDPLGARYDGGA